MHNTHTVSTSTPSDTAFTDDHYRMANYSPPLTQDAPHSPPTATSTPARFYPQPLNVGAGRGRAGSSSSNAATPGAFTTGGSGGKFVEHDFH
jgi:hypothetical protein